MSNSVKQLESEIEKQSNLLHTERLDVSFGELLSMYENGEIIIKPAFQDSSDGLKSRKLSL